MESMKVWSGACKPIKIQEPRTMMQIDRSHYNVPNNFTIPTMLFPLCLVSVQLAAAISAVPVDRIDTQQEK
jgi:hypothetical protein